MRQPLCRSIQPVATQRQMHLLHAGTTFSFHCSYRIPRDVMLRTTRYDLDITPPSQRPAELASEVWTASKTKPGFSEIYVSYLTPPGTRVKETPPA